MSAISLLSDFALQSAIVPPQPFGSSLVLLGTVYSPVIEGGPSSATALPFLVAGFESSVKLIPGSTHFTVDLDPALNQVDDEVVVRTQLGNWTLVGPPIGLMTEALPYDYQHGQPVQPAPLDLSTHYSVDVWNIHSLNVGAFKFRVRFRCFRIGDAVFRYTPCEWSGYSGGSGERQRRLLALPTLMDLSLDDESSDNRLGSMVVQTFSAPDQGFIVGNLSAGGAPDQRTYPEDHLYSDQNVAAFYESNAGLNDLRVNATYGTPGIRPCVLDFSQQGLPRIVNKPKRLHGRLMLYLSGGALTTGSVVTVRIYTGAAPGYVDVPVGIAEDVYNPDYTGFIKAGEADLDITDFEFNRLGVTMDFAVDETNARQAAPVADPEMSDAEPYYYTTLNAPAIRVDTACFRDPHIVPVFEGTFLGSAVPITDCNILACGPVGTYCYVEVSGTGTYLALQPLGFPAPFVAPFNDSVQCYGSPSFMGEYLGGKTDASDAVVGFSGTTGCGVAYQYNPCTAAEQQQLAIVFPKGAVPHPAVAYQDNCYSLIGVVGDTSRLIPVLATDVSPVTGCADVICTGSNSQGGSVDYFDQESLQQVTVSFPHMEGNGVPFFGVAPSATSQGYGATPGGTVNWVAGLNPIPILVVSETATLTFTILPNNIWRELVVTRGGNRQHYRFYPGLLLAQIQVQAGDIVTLEFSNRAKIYAGLRGAVSWEKHVPLPHLYDSVPFTLPFSTGTILALGFCGLNSRQDYSFYGTLNGALLTADLPNPDNIVTVKDTSALSEMVLVRTGQARELQESINLPSYQGQRLTSPVVFNFYAGRTRAGAHGEMDVWLNTDNSAFPPFLTAGSFKSLTLIDSPYRRLTRPTDTSRRGLRMSATDPSDLVHSPRIYADDRGRRLSVVTSNDNDYVLESGLPYTFNGNYDYGVSETLYSSLQGGGRPVLRYSWSVPASPRGLCYVSSTDEVWLACGESSLMLILSGDGTTIKATVSIPASGFPMGAAYCPDTDSIAVTLLSGFVQMFDAQSRTPLALLDLTVGGYYQFTPMLPAYNPVSRNIYVGGLPNGSFDLTLVELDPRTLAVRVFPFGIGAVTLADVYYCPTTQETIVATESGGSFAFNVNTKMSENLAVPTGTCRGSVALPELARLWFTGAANYPNATDYVYDPRSRQVTQHYTLKYAGRGTGWHPQRRKVYISTLNTYLGGPGVSIVNINGIIMNTLPGLDWGYQWVYSPRSALMICSTPGFFFGSHYITVYT